MTVIVRDTFQSQAVGAAPTMPGFGLEQQNNSTFRIIESGGIRWARAQNSPSTVGPQRAELRMDSPTGATSGQTRWFGATINIVARGSLTSWGPAIMQHRRALALGNGPITFGYEINGGVNQWLVNGGWPVYSSGSHIPFGPSAGFTGAVRYVVGIYHHVTSGWVELWQNGVPSTTVNPWRSKDTSSDGQGLVGSTLGPDSSYNAFKFGSYRSASATATTTVDFRDVIVGTTREDVMGVAQPLPTAPVNLRSALTFQET